MGFDKIEFNLVSHIFHQPFMNYTKKKELNKNKDPQLRDKNER